MLRDRDGKRRCGDTGALPQEMQEKCLWTLREPLPLPCHCLGPHGTSTRAICRNPGQKCTHNGFRGVFPQRSSPCLTYCPHPPSWDPRFPSCGVGVGVVQGSRNRWGLAEKQDTFSSLYLFFQLCFSLLGPCSHLEFHWPVLCQNRNTTSLGCRGGSVG